MKVKLPAILGNYDRPTCLTHPTNHAIMDGQTNKVPHMDLIAKYFVRLKAPEVEDEKEQIIKAIGGQHKIQYISGSVLVFQRLPIISINRIG